jgi:DNA-directed RNA polymerase subunit RPC12/RpoP
MEAIRENLIECDYCEFVIPNTNEDKSIYEDISKYLDVPCPNCGENLLTYDEWVSDMIVQEVTKLYENEYKC